jgi:hypothetical protein
MSPLLAAAAAFYPAFDFNSTTLFVGDPHSFISHDADWQPRPHCASPVIRGFATFRMVLTLKEAARQCSGREIK